MKSHCFFIAGFFITALLAALIIGAYIDAPIVVETIQSTSVKYVVLMQVMLFFLLIVFVLYKFVVRKKSRDISRGVGTSFFCLLITVVLPPASCVPHFAANLNLGSGAAIEFLTSAHKNDAISGDVVIFIGCIAALFYLLWWFEAFLDRHLMANK